MLISGCVFHDIVLLQDLGIVCPLLWNLGYFRILLHGQVIGAVIYNLSDLHLLARKKKFKSKQKCLKMHSFFKRCFHCL